MKEIVLISSNEYLSILLSVVHCIAAVLVTFLWGGVVGAFGVLFVELRTEFGLSTSLLSLVVALHTALFTIGGMCSISFISQLLSLL